MINHLFAILSPTHLRSFCIISFLILTACSQQNEKSALLETDFCSSIHRSDTISLRKELDEISHLTSEKTGVYVLEEGATSMVARAWLSEYAEKSIDIQYFIFSTDNVGLIACDYLVRAADRGVKVRIIVDDIMVDVGIQDVLSLNSHKNISIKIYNPGVNLGKNLFSKIKKFTTDFRAANQRMHNKTFIVDEEVVITGGRNIADEYFDYDHEYNFRDRDVLLLGKETKNVQISFNDYWSSSLSVPVTELTDEIPVDINDENRFDRLHEYACNPENFWPQIRAQIENLHSVFPTLKKSENLVWLDNVLFLADAPGKNSNTKGLKGGGLTTSTLIDLIRNAKQSIDIQTPYLITTDLSKTIFREAVQRGVKVRILTNSLASTDNIEAFASYQSDRKELLETGINIYEFRPDAQIRKKIMTGELQNTLESEPIFGLHAKSMVVDEKTVVIGTFNLDPRSANLNTECIVIIHSDKVADKVLGRMEEEFKAENSWKITTQFNPDAEVNNIKRLKTWTRKILPKGIL